MITSTLPDFLNDKFRLLVYTYFNRSDFTDISILDELNIQRIRISPDNVNGYGRTNSEFCKNNQMLILNGRIRKDKFGRPISRNLSVVDYIISTAYFLKNVNDFEVLDFSKLFSDVHSPLHLSLYKNCSSMGQDEEDISFQNDTERI